MKITEDEWTINNREYWEEVSDIYNTFYTDKWSLLENDFIKNIIEEYKGADLNNILDLGCGNGLGYKICSSINPELDYVGVDISSKMLGNLKLRYPQATTKKLSMSDLNEISDNSFDFVISIFTAFSYTDDVNKTLEEIHRVLKPNGKILISVISKYSFRRLLKFKLAKKEKYKTRGIGSNSYSFSWVFSKREINKIISSKFSKVITIGYNPFGGIPYFSRRPQFWKINLIISKLFPNLSHELLITGTKKI